jgi:hypothetical protein
MSVTPAEIQTMIESELPSIHDTRIVSHIRTHLVQPCVVMRNWDYGAAGDEYPCWTVLKHADSGSGIAYCEFGFGPRIPWGLVLLSEESGMSMGMDCDWFTSFLDAFFESGAVTDLSIWRVFKQEGDSYPGVALSPEADWNSTWYEVRRLRAADPQSRYHCSQSIWRKFGDIDD